MEGAFETMLTVPQVAEILGISEDWVYSEVRAGRIPCRRLGKNGRTVRFNRQEFFEWLGAQTDGMRHAGAWKHKTGE